MAHWMKHWPALVAIGCGLVALWLLPPDPPREVDTYVPPTEAQALKVALVNEARRLNDVLKRTRWLDSLTEVLANSQPDENGVIFSFPEGPLNDAWVRDLRSQVAQEIDQLGIENAEYLFAVARPNVYSGNHELFEGRGTTTTTEFYTLRTGDRMVCLMLNQRRGTTLGPCAQFLIHGTPGPAIRSWLSQGAAQFAMRHVPARSPSAGLSRMERLLIRSPPAGLSRSERLFIKIGNQGLFGIRGRVTPGAHNCLAGDEQACRESVLQVKRPARYRFGPDLPAFVHLALMNGPFYTYEESLFYDLEQEFGREAFGRFWTSDQDVDIAFQAAFGLPIGAWVMGWAQARLGVNRMGPMPSLEAIIISLGVISFFLTIAIAMGRRRKVA